MLIDLIKKCGFKNDWILAICEGRDGDLVLVPCNNEASGIYPDFDRQVSLISNDLDGVKFNTYYSDASRQSETIDAMLIIRWKDGYEISFARKTWDGFEIITEEEESGWAEYCRTHIMCDWTVLEDDDLPKIGKVLCDVIYPDGDDECNEVELLNHIGDGIFVDELHNRKQVWRWMYPPEV